MLAYPAEGATRVSRKLSRGEFFGGLFALGCASGLAARVIQSANRLGWGDAFFNTFEISAIVWGSCVAGVFLVLQDRAPALRSRDLVLGAGFVFLNILPVGALSWISITALSIYVVATTVDASSRRGAIILLAVTVPMLWSRLLFQFFANLILQIDASLVAFVLRTDRTGDMVRFADGSGLLVILPACSSLANVSLAILCWVAVSQVVDHRYSARDLLWCLAACVSVITVNVMRISIQGISQWHYDAFHGQWGDMISNMIILGLTLCFSLSGVRRELFHRI
ncbi:conserved membrane hypothetical protein [Hyphomicrobiales bacterium]|nr:conserved membrane hypothetical protein [Hyphomicrobiales bacterium]CAH1699094.1 conserved membrane hypothetical protein [Hyphomicrobiales bacterium]CAI0342883.1 conserved membrane hypothetical protein [Hyphomicrobiales bacterium]